MLQPAVEMVTDNRHFYPKVFVQEHRQLWVAIFKPHVDLFKDLQGQHALLVHNLMPLNDKRIKLTKDVVLEGLQDKLLAAYLEHLVHHFELKYNSVIFQRKKWGEDLWLFLFLSELKSLR